MRALKMLAVWAVFMPVSLWGQDEGDEAQLEARVEAASQALQPLIQQVQNLLQSPGSVDQWRIGVVVDFNREEIGLYDPGDVTILEELHRTGKAPSIPPIPKDEKSPLPPIFGIPVDGQARVLTPEGRVISGGLRRGDVVLVGLDDQGTAKTIIRLDHPHLERLKSRYSQGIKAFKTAE